MNPAAPINWNDKSKADIEAFTLRVNAAIEFIQKMQKENAAHDGITDALYQANIKLVECLFWWHQAVAYRQGIKRP